jgi:hypothetical protein
MDDPRPDDQVEEEVHRIAGKIALHLDGYPLTLQGLILAELVSIWVHEHDPGLREQAYQKWIEVLVDLIKMDATPGAH